MNNDIENDHEMEQFYIRFRDSMKNFYSQHSFTRPLKEWSEKLNNLQRDRKYTEIRDTIVKIISLYATDLMRTGDDYNAGILATNIKRWSKISGINISNSNIVFVLLDIFTTLGKRVKELPDYKFLFFQIELYLLYQDFTLLVEYSVSNNLPSIVEKLLKFKPEILDTVCAMYGITGIKTKLSAKKLFQLINSH